MTTKEIRSRLERLKGSREQIKKDIRSNEESLKSDKRELIRYEQAKEVLREVGIKTQQQLQYHISDITSLALEAVFPDPYKLEVEFIQRRNKTECDIYFSRAENRVDPISASGGGAVDIAAFALRIASWSLERPHSRATIILDEPMRFVSEGLRDQASRMIKEVSQKLGVQFIIITHEPKLAAYADKVFEVRNKKGVSRVTAE
jgi:DNA repair exonuclease SbcCD ATPase subunit